MIRFEFEALYNDSIWIQSSFFIQILSNSNLKTHNDVRCQLFPMMNFESNRNLKPTNVIKWIKIYDLFIFGLECLCILIRINIKKKSWFALTSNSIRVHTFDLIRVNSQFESIFEIERLIFDLNFYLIKTRGNKISNILFLKFNFVDICRQHNQFGIFFFYIS